MKLIKDVILHRNICLFLSAQILSFSSTNHYSLLYFYVTVFFSCQSVCGAFCSLCTKCQSLLTKQLLFTKRRRSTTSEQERLFKRPFLRSVPSFYCQFGIKMVKLKSNNTDKAHNQNINIDIRGVSVFQVPCGSVQLHV